MKKIEKHVANLNDKTEYVTHIRTLKQALNNGLVFRKFHRVIKFNQNAWLKPYIDMNTELRKKRKMILKKIFFKLMNNAIFGKTIKMCENIEILNPSSQQKEEETIWCRNQVIILQSFSQKVYKQ